MAKIKGHEKRPAGSNGRQQHNQKRKSFKDIGPKFSDAGKGTYVNHITKLKERLIHKAKVKKAYARELSKEQNEIHPDSDQDEVGDDIAQVSEDDGMDGLSGSTDEKNSMDVDTTSKRPDNLGQQQRARLQQIMEQDDPVSYKRKAAEDLEDMVNTQASTDAGPSTANHSAYVHPARRKGALKHETLSKRKKNKELSKREPKKIKKSPEEVQQLRAARERDRVSWAKKTKKGQPNLNSRMEVLLGKIERSQSR